MPVLGRADATSYETHGATFESYVDAGRSGQLRAWRLSIPPDARGVEHRPILDETMLVLGGSLHVCLDGADAHLVTGSVVLVPAGTRFRVDGGTDGGTAWVTTTPGLTAVIEGGGTIAPPWAG